MVRWKFCEDVNQGHAKYIHVQTWLHKDWEVLKYIPLAGCFVALHTGWGGGGGLGWVVPEKIGKIMHFSVMIMTHSLKKWLLWMLTLGIKTMLIIAFSTDGVRNYIYSFEKILEKFYNCYALEHAWWCRKMLMKYGCKIRRGKTFLVVFIKVSPVTCIQ